MKKNIGLFADLKNFNTTLPQTKHLNYIMSTNPVGYANGGDVRAGVPSSNMNVTKGFLPMALGFENGGDAGVQYGLYDKLIMVLQGYLGKMGVNKSDAEIAEVAEDLVKNNPQEAENIIAQADTQSVGTGQSNIADTNSRIPPVEMYTDMNQPNALGGRTPTDTAKEFNLENLIQDGKDLFNQKKEEVLEEGLDGIFPDSLIEKRDKEILPYLDNLLNPKKDNNIPQVEEEDVIVPETNDGGISTIPTLPATEGSLVGSNKDLITEDTFKDAVNTDNITDKESKDISNTIATLTGNEKEKDVPKWAIPLMSAGFGMMASKSPYFLQALGEGGQEGIKSLVAQNTAEQDKLDKEAERAFLKARTEQVGRPDAPFKIGNAFYKYDENNKLVKVRNIQRSLTEIEDDLRTRIIGYDNLSLAERQELVKKEELSDQNILYQGDTTEATKDNDRNILDSIKDYIGL